MQQMIFIGGMLYVLWTIRKIRELEQEARRLRRLVEILHWELEKKPSGQTGKPKPSQQRRVNPDLLVRGSSVALSLASTLPKALLKALSGQRRRK